MANIPRVLRLIVCIGLLASFLGCAATPQRAKAGQFSDDSAVTAKVKAAFFDEPSLKTVEITVETFKGVVKLSGFVDSAQKVAKASELASRVAGVVSVQNQLIVVAVGF